MDVLLPLVYVSGYNEPMRTRVHNNAGSEAVIRESFQINIDVTWLKIWANREMQGFTGLLFREMPSQTVDR